MPIHSSNQSPKARKNKLIVKDLPDETLVYDLDNDKAHCLNATSALVWKHCDGQSSVAEIAQSLTAETRVKVDDAVVWLALKQLQSLNLLDVAPAAPGAPPQLAGITRRGWVRTIGLAAIAVPMIMSIGAPTALAAAASCSPSTATCGSNNQCCSNQCCGSPGTICGPGIANNTCN